MRKSALYMYIPEQQKCRLKIHQTFMCLNGIEGIVNLLVYPKVSITIYLPNSFEKHLTKSSDLSKEVWVLWCQGLKIL